MEKTNWDKMISETFGEGQEDITPWIRLEPGVPYVGTIKLIAGGKTSKNGYPFIEVWFSDTRHRSGERSLNAFDRLSRAIAAAGAVEGDTVEILMSEEPKTDRDGNPVTTVKDGQVVAKMDQSYSVKKLDKAPGYATPKADDEIDLSDVPF